MPTKFQEIVLGNSNIAINNCIFTEGTPDEGSTENRSDRTSSQLKNKTRSDFSMDLPPITKVTFQK